MDTPAPSPLGDKLGGKPKSSLFKLGNNGGPGKNYLVSKAMRWRTVIAACVTDADMFEVMGALKAKAKTGNLPAIVEFFNRTLGKPLEADVVERLQEVEAILERAVSGEVTLTPAPEAQAQTQPMLEAADTQPSEPADTGEPLDPLTTDEGETED